MSLVIMCRFLRTPAVSMTTSDLPSFSKRTSTLSRVVPGTSDTITRSGSPSYRPAMAFTKVLLPAFRLPTMATCMVGGGISVGALDRSRSARRASKTASMFRPDRAATPIGVPRPSRAKSPSTRSALGPSALFATSTVLAPCSRSRAAIVPSALVSPSWQSTMNRTRSARAMASSIWWLMCSVRFWASMWPYPPVSTSSTNRPSIWSGIDTRSRVTPGMSWTMLIRLPQRAFRSELLPTFGRPTMATVGREGIANTVADRRRFPLPDRHL